MNIANDKIQTEIAKKEYQVLDKICEFDKKEKYEIKKNMKQ